MSSGSHFRGPLLGSRHSFGGAGENLGIEGIAGESDIVTVFDDFNGYVENRELTNVATAGIEDHGWLVTEVGTPAGSAVGINDDSNVGFDSGLRINCGTAADTGGNCQFHPPLGSVEVPSTPAIWVPANNGGTVLDNTVYIFACRLGVHTDDAAGDFDGKLFIGLAEDGDAAILVVNGDSPFIQQAETGPLVGFHILEDGSLRGISQRTVNTAYAEGTNFTEIGAAGYVDSTLANGAAAVGDMMWFDLALRMDITDSDDDDANGSTTFYHRRVRPSGRTPGQVGTGIAQDRDDRWQQHSTVLLNQTPNNNLLLVPTIEAINGPTDESDFVVDWWTMGISRYSRQSHAI